MKAIKTPRKMGAGVSLSLSRDGVHGEGICSSFIFSLISVADPRELGLSQFSSLSYFEEFDYLVHEKDPNTSDVEVIHRIFLGRSSPQSSESGVSCMQDIVLPKQWGLDLGFRSLRTMATGTMGLFSAGFHLGSPDPITLAPILANSYEKACSWVPALGFADSRVPIPGGSEGLRLDSIVDGEATWMTKKTSWIEQPTGWSLITVKVGSEFWVPDPVDANKGIHGSLKVDPREGVKAQLLPSSGFSVLITVPTMSAGEMGLVTMGYENPNPVVPVPACCFLESASPVSGKLPAMFLPSIRVVMGITAPSTPVFMPRTTLEAGSFGFSSDGSTLSHGFSSVSPELCVVGYGARVLGCIGDWGQDQASGGEVPIFWTHF